ncbi:hypothetical protein [Phycisphaera mikurensis]|uniref:Heparinase II N-terminal domain-containing protein n=1 Tax=Phycisphaera mikurensis (strain NBRC 102666 / KCTC 22515 / FYK2301M01) TaxID=1142394 RepID=I0II01_PHYMF|nr:hypothetical protein [Phycisphaera mikurensis]MBB6442546.1 hypothetical protein [Phycisphaera mikurensis]BAM04889.1 hypothetical protein PSMK_27300 [Phycisphaera mikurensis NBRC 102666]
MRKRSRPLALSATLAAAASLAPAAAAEPAPTPTPDPAKRVSDRPFDGEAVLNRDLGYPVSPAVEVAYDQTGLARDRLGPVPAPGVHPRILFGPDDLPDLRRRSEETAVGRRLRGLMTRRLDAGFRAPGSWTHRAVEALIAGDFAAVEALLAAPEPAGRGGYNREPVLYDLELAALDALLREDATQGERAAEAIAQWARKMEPLVEAWRAGPYGDDAGRWPDRHPEHNHRRLGYQQLGYAYDLAAPHMAEADRDATRRVIARITRGAFAFGMNLPPHLRDWNWINVAQHFTLLSLAIEGEEGYDPRVYEVGVEMMRDYLSHGYTQNGVSTEAVGYTSFGWLWGSPALAAMTRRGENLIAMDRYRAIPRWQLQTMIPGTDRWNSPGDGGSHAPTHHELMVRKFFYPDDPLVDAIYAEVAAQLLDRGDRGHFTLIDALVFADDADAEPGAAAALAAELGLTTTFTDAGRGLMIARDRWADDATVMPMAARTDGFNTNHDHADRGGFQLFALGRPWSADGFRSVESRHHNLVLIDGRGQGYPAAPADVIAMEHTEDAAFLIADLAYPYAWRWPKAAYAQPVDAPKHAIERFGVYRERAQDWVDRGVAWEHETHPNVVAAFEGFDLRDSGMWDEDPWTVRVAHNPVEHAFRTMGLVRGERDYALVVDDVMKDGRERLHAWTMMLEPDLTALSITKHDNPRGLAPDAGDGPPPLVYTDVLLGRDTIDRVPGTLRYKPAEGEPLLLVRVLHGDPLPLDRFDATPAPRVETFEKKDTYDGPSGRTFGLDRRLIVPRRGVGAAFRVLLFPHRHGVDALPEVGSPASGVVELTWPRGPADRISFTAHEDGRTRVGLFRDGRALIELP